MARNCLRSNLRKVKRVGLTKGGWLQKERPVHRPGHLGELVAGARALSYQTLEVFQAAYKRDVLQAMYAFIRIFL